MEDWKITRYGHASKGKDNARIDNEIRESLSRKRINRFHGIYSSSNDKKEPKLII